MATFLELCQKVARDSGTISGALPQTVTGAEGRLGKVVYWTAEAWRRIQNQHASWLWMVGEFEQPLLVSTARYTPAALSVDRHAAWITKPEAVSVYRTKADEGYITHIPFADWRRTFDIGAQHTGRPGYFSVSPAGELCVGPAPDQAYTIRGLYRKGPQELVNDDDVPEMPERFHDLIAYGGLLLLAEHDEAQLHIGVAMARHRGLMSMLRRDQLPMVHIGGSSVDDY